MKYIKAYSVTWKFVGLFLGVMVFVAAVYYLAEPSQLLAYQSV